MASGWLCSTHLKMYRLDRVTVSSCRLHSVRDGLAGGIREIGEAGDTQIFFSTQINLEKELFIIWISQKISYVMNFF